MLSVIKMKKAYQRLLEEQAGENRRFFYFIGAAQNEKYGKDMRLYQLSEVVSGKIDGCLKSLVQLQKKYFSVLARSECWRARSPVYGILWYFCI